MTTTDVFIIGTGQAGVPLATRLAAAGRRVVIAERGLVGGTCMNTGCTPTKTMIASARAAHLARSARRLGVKVSGVEVDWRAVVARKDALVAEWRKGTEEELRSAERVTLVSGHARFVGAREVEVAGERYRAETIIINVGARPAVPPVPGLDSVPWLDNRRALELPALPDHLVIMGGGYIGCELGQMFRRLGSRVTIVDRAERLLDRLDEDVSAELRRVFEAEGITLELGAKIEKVAKTDAGIAVSCEGGRKLEGSHLLVATGRRPNTDDLGCEVAGIELDERGYIVVDDHYRTTVEGVYAVGDAIGQPQFTHTAWDDHRILFELLMGRSQRGRSGRHIPYAVFTDPQIGGVGLTEREAREKKIRNECAVIPFASIARAAEVDEPAGLLKVLIDPATEHILGASIVGAEAGELIHIFVVLMQAGASARAIVDAEMIHPTFAEGVQQVVMTLGRFALTTPAP